MRAFTTVCALLLLLPACGSRTAKPSAPLSSGQGTDLGLEELRAALESTVLENYAQLSYGNIEAFLDGVSSGREVQLVGPTPDNVVVGTKPTVLQDDHRLYRQYKPTILSKNLDVHLSQDGSVGWVYDEVSYRVPYMGREASIPIRSTAVYVRDVERWILVAEHLSYGIPIAEIIALAARGELARGRDIKTHHGDSKKLSGTLVGLLGRLVNGRIDEGTVVKEERTLLLLPAPDQEFHAQDAVDAPSLASLFGDSSSVAIRDFRIEMAPNRRTAWSLVNLAVRTNLNDEILTIGLRGSFVFERRGNEGWAVVQAHISAPLLEEQLSTWVFGPSVD